MEIKLCAGWFLSMRRSHLGKTSTDTACIRLAWEVFSSLMIDVAGDKGRILQDHLLAQSLGGSSVKWVLL